MATHTDKLTFQIAGLVYHVPSEEKECGKFDGMLVPEPDNPHDSHAIKVCKTNGMCVGYVPRNKTWYIEKMTKGRDYSCSLVIYKLMHEGVLMGLEGECTLSGVDLSEIDMEDFRDASVDGRDVEPEVIVRSHELSESRHQGQYVVYLGDWRDAKTIKGYDEAMQIARKVEKAVRFSKRCVTNHANSNNPWWEAKDVCLTVRQKTPWWHCGKVILKMKTVQILECDLYHIEKNILDIPPRRYRKVRKENDESVSVDWFSGGLSLWSVFSFFDSIISSDSTITSVSSSQSSFLDWELFEAQIESDEYFDFGW